LIQGCSFDEAALSHGDLSEVEWRILKLLLPVEREPAKRGRDSPPEDNRNIINGVLWRLRTGAPWRDVPEKYGNWNSIYRRLPWPRAGTTTSTSLRFVPMSGQRAGRKRWIHQRTLGRSRGGFTSKVHCLGDARGRPIAFHLTAGEAADCKAYDTLIDLPEQAPTALLADKAYDTDAIRDDLEERRLPAEGTFCSRWSVNQPVIAGWLLDRTYSWLMIASMAAKWSNRKPPKSSLSRLCPTMST
jgi:transposase